MTVEYLTPGASHFRECPETRHNDDHNDDDDGGGGGGGGDNNDDNDDEDNDNDDAFVDMYPHITPYLYRPHIPADTYPFTYHYRLHIPAYIYPSLPTTNVITAYPPGHHSRSLSPNYQS